MASWSAFLLTYLLGGVTFIPLVLITVLLHAYLTLPYRDDVEPKPIETTDDDIIQPGDDLGLLKATQKELRDEEKPKNNHHETEVAAGYFAVCREYTPMGINAKPIERSTPVGSTTVAAPSPSVYQTMYRSIFERKHTPGPLDNNKSISQRPKKAGNVFYVVLRHGHLMLFDDDEQLEVRHVISLAHHDISIYSGGDTTPEGELFIKRNALCLSRRTDGKELGPDSQISKPFYLFSENCSAKEDFYFALLRNQEQYFTTDGRAPAPLNFEVKDIIALVQKLHSSEDQLQTKWLNAMIGRIFLALYKTADIENFIREKLTKKISRVKRPAFLSNITIQKIDTGESAPIFTNPRLKDLTVEGECCIEADVRYTGNFRLEVAAVARIELGTRLKAREVNLVLAVVVRKLEGHAYFQIKPPPSNRLWFTFQQMPKIEMTIEPIVSTRQITYTVILRQIENRIKEVIAETLVLPFWDDTPFFRTEHKKWRGGIWVGDDAVQSSGDLETTIAQVGDVDDVDTIENGGLPSPGELPPMEKSHSVPVIESTATTGLFGRKLSNKNAKDQKANASSVTVASPGLDNSEIAGSSTSVDPATETPLKPKTERSGSFVQESIPVVGTDAVYADIFKPSSSPPGESPAISAMAKLSARSLTGTPSGTPLASPHRASIVSNASTHSSASSTREGTDSERDNDQTPKSQARRHTASSAESVGQDSTPKSPAMSTKSSIKSQAGSLGRGFFLKRENSGHPLAPDSPGSADSPKRISLAAVSNAAEAAKRWGWNALQKKGEGKNGHSAESQSQVDLTKPMGGGQPLPPPGTPLPMPDKRSKVTPIPVPKRKPIPPPPLPDRRHPEERQPEIKRRPVPPPPLPKRRQVAENDGQGNEDMLVVAAPLADSEPTSPVAEEHEDYLHPWVADVEDDDGGEATPSQEVSTGENEPEGPATVTLHDSKFSPELGTEPADPREEAEEDDDYSAWMDNPVEDEPASAPPKEVIA